MLNYGHLISLSVLKIFLSTIQPWIHFLCDIDTLKYVCDFFFNDLMDHLLFLKNSFMQDSFSYLIWTFWNFRVPLLQFVIRMNVWFWVSHFKRVGVVS